MKKNYYLLLFVTYFISFSSQAQTCSTLEITDSTGGTIVCKGKLLLEAKASGTGNDIYWFDANTGNNILGVGEDFVTPILTQTTSYWAAEVHLQYPGEIYGQGKLTHNYNFGLSTLNSGVLLNVTKPFILVDVEVYSAGGGGGISVSLQDHATGNTLAIADAVIPGGGSTISPVPHTITLNFNVPPGVYRLVRSSGAVPLMYDAHFAGPVLVFPYPLGVSGEISSGVLNGNPSAFNYYYFFNWTISEPFIFCESDREEIIATVSTDGDEVVNVLPYTHIASTATYGNIFSGAPGSGCGSTLNYLNGNEVIYEFTPTSDALLTIELSDITGYYAGLFVYKNCGDIGDQCMDGIVAGPNDADFAIKEFEVEQGETYYIVVSSWLIPNIDYTLSITAFDCATFEVPEGETDQNFISGHTLADLVIKGTMSSVDFTWYSDAAGTLEIPDTTPLVDAITYYVTQTFQGCEGAILAITVHEFFCSSSLEVLNTTNGTVVCLGPVILAATASGTGSEIFWFDAAINGEVVGYGGIFETPVLSSTTSYWAAEVDGVVVTTGQANNVVPGSTSITSNGGLLFDVTAEIIILDVEVFSSSPAGGNLTVELRDANDNNAIIATKVATLPAGGSPAVAIPVTVPLGFKVPPGNYRLVKSSGPAMLYTTAFPIPVSFPFPIGNSGQIINGSTLTAASTSYFYFYNWTIVEMTQEFMCESAREEATATVDQTGDIIITGGLPYYDSGHTFSYGNNFSGAPGCGTPGNYLNGNDVVYQYSPATDDILTIELTGVTNVNSGVFVYANCGDVGSNCLAGVVGNDGVFKIEDFQVIGGQDYTIVISSLSGSTGYTLNIYGYDCTEMPKGDMVQYYVTPPDQTLADLIVNEYQLSTGLNWYYDAAGSNPVTNLPENEILVDGTTYYVTQTVLGCESDALAITVHEFDCNDLEIISISDAYICNEGTVTLTATPKGIGNEVYWYENATGSDHIAVGTTFTTPHLTSTTSYWASDVFVNGALLSTGYARQTWNSSISFGTAPWGSGSGLVFEASQSFTLVDVEIFTTGPGAELTLNLEDAAGTLIDQVKINVSGGTQASPTSNIIPLNFDISSGIYRLVAASGPPMVRESSTALIVYPIAVGSLAEVTSGLDGGFISGHVYYYFYNWTIATPRVECESIRVEVIAEINAVTPDPPSGVSVQEFCDNENTLADVVVVGENIQWYNSIGSPLNLFTILQHGATYYVTQTVEACESSMFGVTILITKKSDKPVGYSNQSFVEGETLADLDVNGQNLTWYADAQATIQIPQSTTLVNQTTYYVSQMTAGLCESDLLGITVYKTLNIEQILFGELTYYPNPMDEILTIVNSHPIEKVELYNLIGQKIINQGVGIDSATIDVSELATGTYLLKVLIDGRIGVYRVIKK